MTQLHLSDGEHQAEEQIEGLPPGFGEGLPGRVAYWIALTFSLFQIWIAAYGSLPSQIVRAMHVGFLLLLGFVLLGNLLAKSRVSQGFYWLLGAAGFCTGLYNWFFYRDILLRSNFLTTADLTMGVVLLVLVFWLARRLMGWPLFIIACLFLGYCAFGENLPGIIGHRGYDAPMLIEHFAFGTEGIYGSPTYVSSAYIFIFVVFAAFLERAGMLDLFNDVALGLVGHWRGGAAHVCTLSSALMGTVSGSGVANVVASGQFTIPLMKRSGFRAAFAGGIEATSSMGGQIMPPIMGAVAFIMAETLNIPYGDVVRAALIPAAMYFGVCFWTVYLESGKHNLHGLPRDQLPSPWEAIKKQWMLMIPLGMLVYLLFANYTPIFAGSMGLALVVVLILATAIAAQIGPFVFRIVFWISVGLASAAFLKYGVNLLAVVVAVLMALCFVLRGAREGLIIVRDSLALGARNALPVATACAIVGIIIGTLTLTGIASTFIGAVIRIGENNLFLSLVLVMLTCLVLGMGIPTIPNYIITSSLAGPALEQLGVPLLISHMFVFYFGIMADLTPPVALACFAAAPMAKVSGLKISMDATRLAIAGFVMPFIAVYSPALMLQTPYPGSFMNEHFGFWAEVTYVTVKAALAIGLWGVAVIGYLLAPARLWERAWALAAGIALILASMQADIIGFVLAFGFILQHWLRHRRPLQGASA
ncbi:TRAP transporter, 4TM/12TM fusion protein [Paracoccus alcaliphilus]|uniref:TRAP transporter, 4TM/12TM fusion protein n=1 Tax=Paracoccus alcaliphilus TaxID=34002 RepID=A0A1H8E2W3_9RHOB|nr:TRAP transporter permease [Paracoccus alcaliphilus]WCR16819.1 TRAP transporter permease [Paracoccus alcaliphilus]SEN13464.1 TRAP transporter, 4TM/12TM fusion protein [Paracoccus alcaliphilus]